MEMSKWEEITGLKRGGRKNRDILAFAVWIFVALLSIYYISLIFYCYGKFSFNKVLSIFFSPDVLFAVKVSLISSFIATLFAMAFALPSAYCLSRFKGKITRFIDSIIDIPVFLSPIAIGAILLVFFSGSFGKWLEKYGISIVFSFWGIVVAQFTIVTALAVRLLKSTFDDIDERYEKMARTLGCNSFQAFNKVTIPLAKNGIIASMILVWARSIGEFGATITLAGATAMKTETLPIAIYLSFASADVDRALAISGVLILVSLVTLSGIRFFSLRRFTG